jgi:putative transposase
MMDLPNSEQTAKGTGDWPHAPPHRLAEGGVYFVTARARDQFHRLADSSMKDWFETTLFDLVEEYGWRLEAWCVLSNHYHVVAHSPEGVKSAESLRTMVQKLHSLTTKELNRRENRPGRTRLWQNYRETHVTYQRSYLARLNYVHQNAVHHGLVRDASHWKWCSAKKFKESVSPAWLKTIASFNYDEIAAEDGE